MDNSKKLQITDLVPDDLNANIGTSEGQILIDRSISELGAGRSVLLDKNNRLIAGNKATQAAIDAGIVDVIVVETDGTKLVAVRRKDVDLDSEKGRKLAIADNATAAANLQWNQSVLSQLQSQWNIDPAQWNISTIEQFEGDINDFFENAENKDKQPKTIKCPHCGEFIEL